jgi:hypothetical protein
MFLLQPLQKNWEQSGCVLDSENKWDFLENYFLQKIKCFDLSFDARETFECIDSSLSWKRLQRESHLWRRRAIFCSTLVVPYIKEMFLRII